MLPTVPASDQFSLAPSSPANADEIAKILAGVDHVAAGVEALYLDLHEHPELSGQEERTARAVATRLAAAGFDVIENVGGFGVAGVLRNGPGAVVALRGDMDALPVQEATGLPYASRATATDKSGKTTPVMHACGHDVHTACLVGAAQLLASCRDRWTGTLLILAQPAEEELTGARAMMADRVYERTVTPDVLIGQHVMPAPAGAIVHRVGALMAGSCVVRIEVPGRGGHASQPQLAIDPIVIAAAIIGRLQTIVSRELGPYAPAVVTVGQIHAGTRPNVIPDRAVMELSVRSFERAVGDQIVAAIERIVRGECLAGRSPSEPKVEVLGRVDPLVIDRAAVERVQAVHGALFDTVVTAPFPLTGSEDVGNLAVLPDGGRIPIVFWMLGGIGAERWDQLEGPFLSRVQAVPGNHNPAFYPDLEPTLRRGMEALASAALAYLHPDAPA